MKLTIELVPKTAWNTNLRSHLSKSNWDKVRRKCYAEAGHRCEICNGVGRKHPVECHERWDFSGGKIKLIGLIALCPSCHEVKHIGLAGVKGRGEIALRHFMKVNGVSESVAHNYVREAFALYHKRSEQAEWEVDFSYLDEYLKSN